jgi:hypothetical protein
MMGTLSHVGVLSREAFDAIEFDAARTGDHRAAAQEMTMLADTGTQTAAMPRADAYMRAGEQWLLADDPAAAANRFLRAIEDGGPSFADPRVPLARALFMMGEADQAEALLRDLAAVPPHDPRTCDMVAELLEERTDLIGALAWVNAGVELCLGRSPGPVATAGDVDNEPQVPQAGAGESGGAGGTAPLPVPPGGDRAELRLLLTLRFRIRNDLGLPEDAYDRLLDELPSERGTVAGSGLPDRTTRVSAAESRSTTTASPSVISPDSNPRAS